MQSNRNALIYKKMDFLNFARQFFVGLLFKNFVFYNSLCIILSFSPPRKQFCCINYTIAIMKKRVLFIFCLFTFLFCSLNAMVLIQSLCGAAALPGWKPQPAGSHYDFFEYTLHSGNTITDTAILNKAAMMNETAARNKSRCPVILYRMLN